VSIAVLNSSINISLNISPNNSNNSSNSNSNSISSTRAVNSNKSKGPSGLPGRSRKGPLRCRAGCEALACPGLSRRESRRGKVAHLQRPQWWIQSQGLWTSQQRKG